MHDAFLGGSDLIVQAPTGGGKTRGALEPGLESLNRHLDQPADFPGRIIYTTPLRSLTHGFQSTYAKSAQNYRWERSWHPTVQTGEQPDDPLFEGQVIFATIDQVLASFLNIPYSIPRRLDNINAGAMIGSYLVFDEFHLYPRAQMMVTVIAMLKMLRDVSRFTLMTATCSAPLLHKLRDLLGATLIADAPGTPLNDSLFDDIEALRKRQRTWHVADSVAALNADEVRRYSASARATLVICNVVDRAQALYEALKDDGQRVTYLLHSRFYRADRQRLEQDILARLDPDRDRDDRPVIVIATQVVEVGFDISADVLLTECAPAASLIQRAGRCARRSGEGRVIVYLPRSDDGDVNYAPYHDDGFADICQKTWDVLRERFNGQVMDFPEEQLLVELAHGEADEKFAATLNHAIEQRISEITDCMQRRSPGFAGALIRSNDSVPLYINANPNGDDAMTQSLGRYQAFSLSRGRIARLYDTATEADCEAPFFICGGFDETIDDPDGSYPQRFIQWQPLHTSNEVYQTSYRAFAVHPLVVGYSSHTGLRLAPDVEAAPGSPPAPPKPFERIHYEAERYHEHLIGLRDAYTKPLSLDNRSYTCLRDDAAYALKRLCADSGKGNPADVERLLRLTLALHDLGKLNRPWQEWAQSWQRLRAERLSLRAAVALDDTTPLAHTDYDPASEAEHALQRELNRRLKRGPHAVESAAAAADIVRAATDGDEFWTAVVLGTIAHHHTPEVEGRCSSFAIADNWEATFTRALGAFDFDPEVYRPLVRTQFREAGEDVEYAIEDIRPQAHAYDAALFYLLFVRILRLADQRAGHYWRQYRGAYANE